MPNGRKRGSGNGGRERGYYSKGILNEHDDRMSQPMGGESTRRVSFKSHGSTGPRRKSQNRRQRGWDNKLRQLHLSDEDIGMLIVRQGQDNFVHSNHFRHRGAMNRRNLNNFKRYPRETSSGGRRILNESPSHYYKVTIRYGNKYEKDYLLKLLAGYIKPTPLVPYGFKTTKEECSFVVDNHQAAEELLNADRRITVSDGWKLAIIVRPITPFVEVDDRVTEGLKRAMAARYNSFNKTLNLSKFHEDIILREDSIFYPLNRPNLLIAIMSLIGESIPDLVGLDVSNNMINTTEHMKILVDKAPYLKSLHIGNNKLRDVKQLDSLKGLPLEELVLNGNLLCEKFNEKDQYIRAIRQRFPKVSKLDGVELPPPILFGVEDEGRLPSSQASFMCDPAGADIIRQFLEQYYQIYDADSRQPLIQAYHDQATFSMDSYHQGDNHSLSSYFHESRNLLRVNSDERRQRLLRRGPAAIVDVLTSLPNTQHDPTSFTVDLVIFTPELIEVCVCGLFREKLRKAVRFFSRVFVIVAVGSGFCIVNEQLTILSATSEQAKKSLKLMEMAAAAPAAVSSPPAASSQMPAVPGPMVAPVEPDLPTKQQMVTALALKTNMNLVWSEKCLVETNWNFDQALYAFTELQKKGTIPPEAFVK